MQEQFISYLKAKAQNNTSFVEEVASVLDIGYDAAYRRINLKTSISLEESVKLAKHYKISLNNLFEVGSQDTILTELSPKINNEKDLELWLKQSLINLSPLTKIKSATLIYAAKDIPIFHSLKDTFLTRFKMFVWLKDVDLDLTRSKVNFEDFINSIPDTLMQSAYALSDVYKNINITEIWSENTMSGSFQQVLYYYEAGLLSKEHALNICEDFEDVINHTEEQTILQSHIGSQNKAVYQLYKSDLHPLNNTIMVVTPYKKIFFSPYTVLNYFKVEHQDTCTHIYDFLQKQMANSKLLANTGERDRSVFFKRLHNKLSSLKDRIVIDEKMSFL
ncbi:hypothetical protein SAMN05428642_103268 [Flaviramulus basaltis]|uniref:BetR domain-containing protein n=1 Tax=Flaviramulus basaltis TaxID=369401 RepID=A0A1K2IN45_9FLAO|nr:hypothetical protein [Flaviramulus basaltis]SFZ93674.1 hypothetical protein SAMN05428642_103268 [Flaviramulus basaltis]